MTVLRQRMTEDMQVRNLSPHTQASYLQQVSLFARYFRTSPDALTPEHIRTYQIYLTNEKKLAPNSIHTAVAALRFLYRITLRKEWTFGEDIPLPKKPQKLPVVLSPEEVVHFLGCVDCGKHRVILTTCYAAGLRISEAVRLKAAASPPDPGRSRRAMRGCAVPASAAFPSSVRDAGGIVPRKPRPAANQAPPSTWGELRSPRPQSMDRRGAVRGAPSSGLEGGGLAQTGRRLPC